MGVLSISATSRSFENRSVEAVQHVLELGGGGLTNIPARMSGQKQLHVPQEGKLE